MCQLLFQTLAIVNQRSQVPALKELQQGSGELTNSGWLQQRVVGIMKKNKAESGDRKQQGVGDSFLPRHPGDSETRGQAICYLQKGLQVTAGIVNSFNVFLNQNGKCQRDSVMLVKEKHIRSQEAGVKGEVRTPPTQSAPTTLPLHPISPKWRAL